MHFYTLAAYSPNIRWHGLTKKAFFEGKLDGVTVLYEPSEEADEFIGSCLMLGVPINFIKIDTSIEIPEGKRVHIYSSCEPMVATTLTGRLITLYPSSYLSSDGCTQ